MRFKLGAATLASLALVVTLAAAGLAMNQSEGRAQEADQEWDFSDVSKIEIDGVSGDVTVRPASGSQGKVQLRSDVTPADAFEARVRQRGSTLRIDEKWHGNSSGPVEWTIYLPTGGEAPRLDVNNASGDLDCEDVSARIEYDTASGDVTLVRVDLARGSDFSTASGDFTLEDMTIRADADFSTASGDVELTSVHMEDGCEFSTASGDIRVSRSTGSMEFSSASGDVEVRGGRVQGMGRFSSASGDVSVQLEQLPAEGMTASSASGRVTLDVDDYGDDFSLVLIKRQDRGRIRCPFDFTSERTFEEHHVYEEKTVKRGSGSPEIELRTASGSVTVKK